MSSTNRQNRKDDPDYYVTPIPPIVEFLKALLKVDEDFQPINSTILDSCAGGDKDHPMSYPEALKQIGVYNVYTMDIRKDSRAKVKKDFLQFKPKEIFDIVITNPPFWLAVPAPLFLPITSHTSTVIILQLGLFHSVLFIQEL